MSGETFQCGHGKALLRAGGVARVAVDVTDVTVQAHAGLAPEAGADLRLGALDVALAFHAHQRLGAGAAGDPAHFFPLLLISARQKARWRRPCSSASSSTLRLRLMLAPPLSCARGPPPARPAAPAAR